MGCIGSVPMVENAEPIQRLPVKPHLRQTFGQANSQGNGIYEPGQPTATVRQVTVEHDLVILHSSTGSSYCTSLAHALSTPPHSLSVWLPTDQQKPAGSTSFARHSTAGEISPCSTNNVSRPAHCNTALDLNPAQVATAVSHSGCGTLVLVTAGSTWDEGLLACLRHSTLKERPLVLVHAPESCPAPNMSDWPLDVQQQLTNRATPMLTFISSYAEHAAQHVVDALREQLQQSPQKQLRQSPTLQTGLSSSLTPDVYQSVATTTPKQASNTPTTQGNGVMAGQFVNHDSNKQLSSSSPAGMTTSSFANLTSGSSGWQSSQPDSSATVTPPNSSEQASPSGNGPGNVNGLSDKDVKLQKPWQVTLQRLSDKPRTSQDMQDRSSSEDVESHKVQMDCKQAQQQLPVTGRQGSDKSIHGSGWGSMNQASESPQYDIVLAAHHHTIGSAVCQVAAALAPFQRVLVVDGIGCLTRRHNTLGRISTQSQLGEMWNMTHPQRNGKQQHKPLFSINSLNEDLPADNNTANQRGDMVNHETPPDSRVSLSGITPELQLDGIANSVLGLDKAHKNGSQESSSLCEHNSQTGVASSREFPPGGLAPIMALLPCMHLPSSAAGLASQLLEPSGTTASMAAANGVPHRPHHARSISVGTGLNSINFKSPWQQQGCYLSHQQSVAEEWDQQGFHVVSSVSAEARSALAGGCRHYVLFPGLNLGTASTLAVNEVQAALQGGAMMHVVCEASFNLIPPDTRQWPLCHAHLKQLLQAWDTRLLYYHDHLDPLLEKLATRISAAGTSNLPPNSTAVQLEPVASTGSSRQNDKPGPASSSVASLQHGDISQHDKLQRVGPEMKHAVGGVTALLRAASDVSGIPGVADLCLQLTTARPGAKQFTPTPTPLSVV